MLIDDNHSTRKTIFSSALFNMVKKKYNEYILDNYNVCYHTYKDRQIKVFDLVFLYAYKDLKRYTEIYLLLLSKYIHYM